MTSVAASTLLTLLGIGVAWIWLQKSLDDFFRQKLFSRRDELFELVSSGALDADHPAHEMNRAIINGLIRDAHRFRLGWLLFESALRSVLMKGVSVRPVIEARLSHAMSTLPPETRVKIERVIAHVHKDVVAHIAVSSISCWILVLAVSVVALPIAAFRWQARSMSRVFDGIKKWPTIARTLPRALRVIDSNAAISVAPTFFGGQRKLAV